MIRILVSACLLGDNVRYNGTDAASSDTVLGQWCAEGRVVRFCPEVAGGLGVPRPPAEIVGPRGGAAVLDGRAHVATHAGADVTNAFVSGAQLALEVARAQHVRVAVLKEGSPSCGTHRINDGTFTGRKIEGDGVTAALLERHGIRVFSEQQVHLAARYVDGLERTTL